MLTRPIWLRSPARRSALGIAGALVLAGAVLVAAPARADVFSNPAPIAIPELGQANPYPSTIDVAGLDGTIEDVNVTITALTHTYPDDVDILLVGPAGQTVVLMADTGDDADLDAVILTFDDAATASLPDEAEIVSGTYKPTSGATCDDAPVCGFGGDAPAPAGPYGATLDVLNGAGPNGAWSLFVYDDEDFDSGFLAGGWSLDIATTGGSPDHERTLTLRVGGRARGAVRVEDGFSACASHVPVKVQRRQGGSWRTVGRDETGGGGAFVVPGTGEPGRYRAIAKSVELPSGDLCRKAISPVVTS